VHKVVKPKITAIDIKRDGKSAWRAEWEKMPSTTMEPEFVDYTTAIQRTALKNGVELLSVTNPTNDLFSLRYIVEMGTNHDREMEVATEACSSTSAHPSSVRPTSRRNSSSSGFPSAPPPPRTVATSRLSGLEKNLEAGWCCWNNSWPMHNPTTRP
jgi:hypothetical protein